MKALDSASIRHFAFTADGGTLAHCPRRHDQIGSDSYVPRRSGATSNSIDAVGGETGGVDIGVRHWTGARRDEDDIEVKEE